MSEKTSENQEVILSDVPDDLVEIHDPEIDVETIMTQIRETMARRRLELGYEQMKFPSFGSVVFPGRPDDIPYDPELYHHLRLANKIFTEVETEAVLIASPATRLPIVGRLWGLIRSQAHNLILFYVNRLADHQVNFQRHLISAVNLVTAENQQQQRRILELEGEIADIRSRLDGHD